VLVVRYFLISDNAVAAFGRSIGLVEVLLIPNLHAVEQPFADMPHHRAVFDDLASDTNPVAVFRSAGPIWQDIGPTTVHWLELPPSRFWMRPRLKFAAITTPSDSR
jgi:hypothetical protein